MKIEVNVRKKYFFVFLISFIFIAGAAIVYAATPNPGHNAEGIGPGIFPGTVDDIWRFSGKIMAENTKPTLELHDMNSPTVGQRWRMLVDNGILRFDMSTDPDGFDDFFASYATLISFNKNNNTGLNTADPQATLHVSSNNGAIPLARFQSITGTANFVQWFSGAVHVANLAIGNINGGNKLILHLTPGNGEPDDVVIENGYVTIDGKVTADKFEGELTSPIYLPAGTWCGWSTSADNNNVSIVKCSGSNPFNSCPTGFVKRQVTNAPATWACLKT